MLDNVFSFFEKLLINFTWTRLTFLVSLLVTVAGGVFLFEFYTGHFRLGRMEREVKIVEQVVDLSKKVENIPKLESARIAYEKIAKQVAAETAVPPLQIGTLPAVSSRLALGAVPWLVLGVIVLVSTSSGRAAALGGMTVIAVPLIAVGLSLPDSLDPRIPHFIYPWGSLIFVMAVILFLNRKKGRSK
jgi:hypothetical protein